MEKENFYWMVVSGSAEIERHAILAEEPPPWQPGHDDNVGIVATLAQVAKAA